MVLELLEGEMTLNQISSKYEVTPKSLKEWHKTFLTNASLAFDKSKATAEYKEKIQAKDKEISELDRQLGKRIAEVEWASKKLKLGL